MGVFQLGRLLEAGACEVHHALPRSDHDALSIAVHRQQAHRTSFQVIDEAKRKAELTEEPPWTPGADCHWNQGTGVMCADFKCNQEDTGPSECVKHMNGEGREVHECMCTKGHCPIEVGGGTKKCMAEDCAKNAAETAAKIEHLKQDVVDERQALGMQSDQTLDELGDKVAGQLGKNPDEEQAQLGVHEPVDLSPAQVEEVETRSLDSDLTRLPVNGVFQKTLSIEDLIKEEKGTSVGANIGGGPSRIPLAEAVASIANEAGEDGLGATVKQYSSAVANLMEASHKDFVPDKIALLNAEDVPGVMTPMLNSLAQVLRGGSFLRHKLASLSEAANMMDGRAIAVGRARLKGPSTEAVVSPDEEKAEVNEEVQKEHNNQLGLPGTTMDEPLGSYVAEPAPDTENQKYYYLMADYATHPELVPRGTGIQAAPDDMKLMYNTSLRKYMKQQVGPGIQTGQPGYAYDYGLSPEVPSNSTDLVEMMTDDQLRLKGIRPHKEKMLASPTDSRVPLRIPGEGVLRKSGFGECDITEWVVNSLISTHAATQPRKAAHGSRWHSALLKFL